MLRNRKLPSAKTCLSPYIKRFSFLTVECNDPGDVNNAQWIRSSWPYKVNSRVSYKCDACYTGGGIITCQRNGQWTQKPTCTGKMQIIQQILYLQRNRSVAHSSPIDFFAEKLIPTTIFDDIAITSFLTFGRFDKISQGLLSQTTIFQVISSVITCSDPMKIENGVRIPAFGPYTCADQVTYICNHGYQLQGNATLVCGSDGRFSSAAAECVEPSECSIVTLSCVINIFNTSGGSRIFLRGCANSQKCYYFAFFAKNCMKMKEFDWGGARPWRPPWIRQ